MAVDPRFLADSGPNIYTGNELLVKGALEAEGGVHLMTGYPGSPVSSFFDTLGDIRDMLMAHGVRAFQSNNEALGAAALNGSQMLACRAIAVMKSVGVHVASDALALANLAGAHPEGGAIVVSGEDPWCDSTQVPADSRFLFEHVRMAVVEPGDTQQLKDWIGLSFNLSRAAGLYVGYIVTTAQADGGGTVICRPNQFPRLNTRQRVALETAQIDLDRVLLPPRTWQHELAMDERYERTIAAARELGVNAIFPASRMGVREYGSMGVRGEQQHPHTPTPPYPHRPSPLGFIVTGMAGPFLRQVLADVGLGGAFPVLQMGLSYPADAQIVRDFSRLCKTMVVVEERRGFLEKNIRQALFDKLPHDEAADIGSRLYGKSFPHALKGVPATRGLSPSVLAQTVLPLIQAMPELPASMRNGRLTEELELIRKVSKPRLQIVSDAIIKRTPTFCPGCPHRDSSAALLELRQNLADPRYMERHHRRGPVDLVAHGDTGCYTMLMFAPTEQLMHNYSGMGLGAGTGSGIDPFITNKQLVFMGDSTFFHSGQVAISNAIKANQDITFIILENKTTAMTGHQEHPGTDLDVLGNRSYIQDIHAIVSAMGETSPLKVVKMSPADRGRYRRVLEEAILADGVKVVIADKECGITFNRKVMRQERQTIKKKGHLPRKTYMNVTPEVCEHCLQCTAQTACPGLTVIDTDYGRKIDTDLTWCVNDGACERVRVSAEHATSVKPCPAFEQATVVRSRRKRYTLPFMDLGTLPDAEPVHPMDQPGATWRAHLAGVGGMGIGVVSAILTRAGHKDGYRVLFSDRKGLAIRNGGTYSQVTFVREGPEVRGQSSGREDAASAADAQPPYPPAPILPYSGVTTAAIPYGRADLLLGIDILEAARAVDPREMFRIASPGRTAAVLNLYKQPTVSLLLGKSDFEPQTLRDVIAQECRPDQCFARDLGSLCEQRLGSKQYVNLMILGMAYQLGHIPVSRHSIAWAIREAIPREHRKNLKAFDIGRKLALEPRALMTKPQPQTWEQLLRNKQRVLEKSRLRGRTWSARLESLVQGAVARMDKLSDEAKYDLTVRIYDVMQYQDHRLAQRYVDGVARVYDADRADRGYAATAATIWNLAKVLLVKDEPYVSYLLTRYEKHQRDIIKYNVDVANGDRIVYRHHTNPELNIGPWRLRLRIDARPWMLRIMRHCKWLRRLPGWHRREREFGRWYVELLDRISLATDEDYATALEALRCPQQVAGYREVRYGAMDAARRQVDPMLGASTRPAAPAAQMIGSRAP